MSQIKDLDLNLITFKEPNSPMSESYRTLRTNIQFSSFDKKIKTLLITSSLPGEGKTTTSSNLAMVMAQAGNKTLLIDCDQRKPQVHKVFGFSNRYGLSNILVDEIILDSNMGFHQTQQLNLHILSSGTRPPNPAELLGSEKMKDFIEKLKNTYDFIILDTPPIILVTDAQILAQYVDGCLLVVAAGEADRDSVIKSKGLLEKVDAKILGTVINKVDIKKKGYYHYQYEYGESNKANSKNKRRK